jgi:hypothetical protein
LSPDAKKPVKKIKKKVKKPKYEDLTKLSDNEKEGGSPP